MTNLGGYFHTDWAALTLHDWIGLIITVTVSIVMVVLYVYVLHPSNRERLEAQRHLLPDDDDPNEESKP